MTRRETEQTEGLFKSLSDWMLRVIVNNPEDVTEIALDELKKRIRERSVDA